MSVTTSGIEITSGHRPMRRVIELMSSMRFAIALLVGGVLFIVIEHWLAGSGGGPGKERGDLSSVTWTVAVAVGLGQLVAAAFPGSSRSGTTIMFAVLL